MTAETEMSIIRAIQQYLELAGCLAIEAKTSMGKTDYTTRSVSSIRSCDRRVAGVAHSVEEAIEPIGLNERAN